MTLKTVKTFGAMALVALGVAGAGATSALADQTNADTDMAEAQAFLAAPGSISDAIAAAEKSTGGKAMSASFESDATNAALYEVEVAAADGTMSTVMVNPADGTVQAKANEAEDAQGTDAETDDDESGDGENESN